MTTGPSLNELAEFLAERAGRMLDTVFVDEMKMLVGIWRSRLLRDSLERNKQDRAYFRQYFEVPLVQVNVSELPGFPNKPVMRTKCTLPDPVRANGIFFDYVGSVDKLSEMKLFTEQHEIIPSLWGRFTGGNPKALLLNKFIYVWNFDGPYLGCSGVFDDPSAVDNLKCGCTTDTCYDDDKPYPISGDIKQRIIQSILSVELRINTKPNNETVGVDAPASV